MQTSFVAREPLAFACRPWIQDCQPAGYVGRGYGGIAPAMGKAVQAHYSALAAVRSAFPVEMRYAQQGSDLLPARRAQLRWIGKRRNGLLLAYYGKAAG